LPTPNLDHPAIAHKRQGTGGGISRHTSGRPRQGTRPSEPCPNAFADGRSSASSSFPCAGSNQPANAPRDRPARNIMHLFVRTPVYRLIY
jgi:hypothetical protein